MGYCPHYLLHPKNIDELIASMQGCIRKLLRGEGAEQAVSEKKYCALVQEVLFFGSEACLILVQMAQRLKVVHVGFLCQVTRSNARRMKYGSWRQAEAKTILQGVRTHSLRTYVDRRQATVAEWVSLRSIFDVCARETVYEGGGGLQVPWWRHVAA